MAKRYDIPTAEKEIGVRLCRLRNWMGLSRVSFARKAGLETGILANYEHGRARLNYAAAWKVLTAFQLNPECLAVDNGRYFPPVNIPSPAELKAGPRPAFSHIYRLHLAKAVEKAVSEWSKRTPPLPSPLKVLDASPSGRLMVERTMVTWLQRCILCVPDAHLADLVNGIRNEGTKLLRSFPVDSKSVFEMRSLEMNRLRAEVEGRGRSAQNVEFHNFTETETNDLQTISASANIPDAMNLLEKLRADLKRNTRVRGTKSALAAELGVTPASLSQWLSGDREPGGETTLKLLRWVERRKRSTK